MDANEARSSHLTEYEPVISILDPIQVIFDDLRTLFFVKFLRNPSKSSPDGLGRPKTEISPFGGGLVDPPSNGKFLRNL